VGVASTIFNNSSLNYTVGSAGGYNFQGTGAFLKTGSGLVAINTLGNTSGAVTVSGGTLNGSGSIAGTSFALEAGTIGLSLVGSGGLTKDTAGMGTVNGANTYTGSTTLNAVTLNLNSAGAIGNSTTGGIV
ncbi:hypothetical protein, partial [Escherichia coli]|uniref:hypothetical protein n=1 Tax=Escherichia coli TaxID=562 RepID=UPI001B316D2E